MSKDQATQALAAKRWKNISKEDRRELSKAMNAARWGDKTEEEKQAEGQRLAKASAAKRKKAKPATKKKALS